MRQDADGTTADATIFSGKVMTTQEAGEVVVPNQVSTVNEPPRSTEPPRAAGRGPSKSLGKRVVDWVLARNELAQARADAAQFTVEQREFLRRAKVALELGELAFAPGNAVRSGSAAPLAANLFRQAMYWALLLHRPKGAPLSPEQLWAEADPSLVRSVAGSEGELAYFTVAMRSSFIELADGTDEAQRASAIRLRGAANRLVATAQRVLWRLEWAKLKRLVRVGIAVLIPLLAIVWIWPKKVDLGKGAPWRVSSIGTECHPEKSECGGVTTKILFHTLLESNPWFEYDFGSPVSFSSLEIQNRSDFGPDRAVPLVVEVSNDDKSFKEVVRQPDSFTTWSPHFPTQRARYLRLRVARDSILHLESIKVHP